MSAFPPAFLIAGTHSGVGKTTVSFTLMALFQDLGYKVQPFKIGPDFIDPGYHRIACGRTSINLDLWMMGLEGIKSALHRYGSGADIAILEGMGGLFDGENGTEERGSAAYFAKALSIPVILVVDAWGMTRSTGAVIKGFREFDPDVVIAGVVLNRLGSQTHFEMIRESLPKHLQQQLWGYLPQAENYQIPERHLGLLTVHENRALQPLKQALITQAKATIQFQDICAEYSITQDKTAKPCPIANNPPKRTRLGLAKDEAFCFYYEENLSMFRELGIELVPFSPVHDTSLPEGLDGLYFGGGYPEVFAAQLAQNHTLRSQIHACAAAGWPIYGECGGMMYLGEQLVDFEGKNHDMVGILPLSTAMDRQYLAIDYVEITTRAQSLLGPAGTQARGQAFHQSKILQQDASAQLYSVKTSRGKTYKAGFARWNTLGSYIHLHFASNPAIPAFLHELMTSQAKHSS